MAKHAGSSTGSRAAAKRQRKAAGNQTASHAARSQQARVQAAVSPDPVMVKLLGMPPPDDETATPPEPRGRPAHATHQTSKPSKRQRRLDPMGANASAGTEQKRHQDSTGRSKPRAFRAPPTAPRLDLCPVILPRPPSETSPSERRYVYPPVVGAAASTGQAGWTQSFCAGGIAGTTAVAEFGTSSRSNCGRHNS